MRSLLTSVAILAQAFALDYELRRRPRAMPHLHSPPARARRYDRAVKRGYVTWPVDVTAAYNGLPEPEDVVCKPPDEWLEARRQMGLSTNVVWKMKRLLPGKDM